MQVAAILEEKAKTYPRKPAFIFEDKSITFGQLRNISFRLADSLRNLGIKKGDKVAIYLPNRPEYVYSYLAIWCYGLTAVPLDFMLTEEELISCVAHSDAVVLITKPKANVSLASLKQNCPTLKEIILCNESSAGFLSFEELLERGKNLFPEITIQDKDYAIIFYTSGTTGKP
jgi:acyl-CoA synthetase (AMP-forming)/AMP-acid ligase II